MYRPEGVNAEKVLEQFGEITSFTRNTDLINAGMDAVLEALKNGGIYNWDRGRKTIEVFTRSVERSDDFDVVVTQVMEVHGNGYLVFIPEEE